MRYAGPLYRAINPVYARDPLSGEGARRFGGRFNARGTPALYTSLSPHTALRESSQMGTLQPTVLVGYEADLEPVFDATSADALEGRGASLDLLSAPTWRDEMSGGRSARTQTFAADLVADGFAGLLVRSFARGASPDDLNLVLFRWTDRAPARLVVVDDEGRLSR